MKNIIDLCLGDYILVFKHDPQTRDMDMTPHRVKVTSLNIVSPEHDYIRINNKYNVTNPYNTHVTDKTVDFVQFTICHDTPENYQEVLRDNLLGDFDPYKILGVCHSIRRFMSSVRFYKPIVGDKPNIQRLLANHTRIYKPTVRRLPNGDIQIKNEIHNIRNKEITFCSNTMENKITSLNSGSFTVDNDNRIFDKDRNEYFISINDIKQAKYELKKQVVYDTIKELSLFIDAHGEKYSHKIHEVYNKIILDYKTTPRYYTPF